MKQNKQLTPTCSRDLKKILDSDTFNALRNKLKQQITKDTYKSKNSLNDTLDIKTPSTVDTALRSRGSAISKSIRPESRSKGKTRPSILSRPSLNFQNTVTKLFRENQQDKQESVKNSGIVENSVLNRKVLTDRAVYYGQVQLPYLHSSDAISTLYQRPKAHQKPFLQPLINPPSSISPSILTSIKNLYLYYTQLDSLRQLGTGWSNLKSLTICCSYKLIDLAGLTIFPSLEYLFVPHNNIREISDIMYNGTLRCLDLSDNKIDLMDQVQYVYTIGNLEWVDLSQNPIAHVKEKWRIVCENLGNKMQIQDNNRPFQYQISEFQLDSQAYSYQNMEVSNNLIKEINQQILKQDIKVGDVWRYVQEKKQMVTQPEPKQFDVEIIQSFNQQDSYQDGQQDEVNDDKLQLRVTPLIDYTPLQISIGPLKKYFQNKVYPQSKQQKQKQSPSVNQADEKQESNEVSHRRFAATQKLTGAAVSEQKKRLTSVSVRKKIGKLSLSKNVNLASTASSVLTSLKTKQQFSDMNMNNFGASTNLKFIGKRRLLSKLSQEVPQ